jgi:PAS domain S-box-containing protein
MAYGVAVLATAVCLLLRWPLQPVLGESVPHMTFFPAVMIAAYYGGLWPGLLATILSAVAANSFRTAENRFLHLPGVLDVPALILFVLTGAIISVVTESLHRSRRRVAASERRYAITLTSIGDAVIATDAQTRVTFLNPAAEALTEWPLADAAGRPLNEVFRLINERTRQPVEDAAAKVLRGGVVVGLANPARLLTRDGREAPIDNCGAPIIDDRGDMAGVVLVFRDVTERRQAEEAEAFRRVNERLELAVRGSNVGVWEYETPSGDSGDPRLHYVNFWEQLGYERPPAGRTDAMAEVHPDDLARVEEAIRRYTTGETAEYETEARLRHKDGSFRTMLSRGAAVRDASGKVIRFVGISIDITNLKLTEEALRESEQRWRSLTEALPQLVWSATPDGACDYFSTQWTEHTGVVEAGLLGWQWLETLHPQDREPTRHFWLESVAGRRPYDVEYRVRRHDGQYRWFKTRGVPIRNCSGNIVKWFGTCTDITDLRQTEEALRASERRFRCTFENAAVGIAHTDLDGRWLRVNQKFCSILGYTVEELTSPDKDRLSWQDLTYPEDLPASTEPLAALIAGEWGSYSLEKRYVRKDGSIIWGHLAVSLQRDAAGRPCYVIAVLQDISERKRLEGELRQAKEAAEAANRAKDEFLANVSHEIRTPMNAILGMTELTLGTPLTEDQRQCLRTVKSAADNLLDIINDLLDFSKIEAGKMELHPTDFSLRAALADTLRVLAVRAHTKGLELISHVQSDVPDALIGDAGRLRQVLLNLVGNAIKFTDEGEVQVRVEVREATTALPSSDWVDLRFTVRDTGIGIAKDQQERIFRAFEQEDTSTTRKYGGTGLGLAIASRLVALMDGQITVESEPGWGSSFIFTVQFRRQLHQSHMEANDQIYSVASSPDQPVTPSSIPLRILVAEDNDFNAQLMEQLLGRRGHQVQIVNNGREALARAEDGTFDLLLLDVHMPELDGFQVVRAVRERERTSGDHLPIIALTARSRQEDREQSLAAGMDDFLTKPIQAAELQTAIERIIESNRRANRPRTNLLDPRAILAACGGDAVILERICQAFQAHLPGHVTAVRSALREGDTPWLREAAHKLAGMLAAFSTVAGGVASDLEEHAARGQLAQASALVERLETMAQELIHQAGGLSPETLRQQIKSNHKPEQTTSA